MRTTGARQFVQESMGDMAASAILAGRGNSGDAVRGVTALAEVMHGGTITQRNVTDFWRQSRSEPESVRPLDADAIVALVKCVTVECSVDFDYELYYQLPLDFLFS